MKLFHKKQISPLDETNHHNNEGNANEDNKSFLTRLTSKFKRGKSNFRHRKMERLIRTFLIAISVFVLGGAYSIYHGSEVQKKKLQAITPVGATVSFSKTGATLTTTKPYISSDLKTAFVPFELSSMEDLTTDAERYYTIIGSTKEAIGYSPNVQLVLFGETGRGSFIIHGKPRVESESVQLYLRNDKLLVNDEAIEGSSLDGSQAGLNDAAKIYDLIFLVSNPAAKNVTRDKALNPTTVDPEVLYATLFANDDVKIIQERIKSLEKEVEVTKVRVSEYEDRLKRDGYKIPEQPVYMKKDWKPKTAPDVDLNGTLAKGLILNEMETEKVLTPEDIELETQDENISSDYDSFEERLTRDDGTFSDDEVNLVEGQSSPQENWTNLTSMYSEVYDLKNKIYVDEGMNLYKTQKAVERLNDTTSLSSGERFSVMNSNN